MPMMPVIGVCQQLMTAGFKLVLTVSVSAAEASG